MSHIVDKIYEYYNKASGSYSISSKCALNQIYSIVSRKKPLNILEIGSGIGTITSTIIAAWKENYPQNKINLVCWENDDFCLKALKKNLRDDYHIAQILNNIETLNSKQKFDLIVVDGGTEDHRFYSNIDQGGIIFLEGGRTIQRDVIISLYRNRKFVIRNGACFFDHIRKIKSGYIVIYFDPGLIRKLKTKIQHIIYRILHSSKFIKTFRFFLSHTLPPNR